MGLDMYLNKMPRYNGATASDVAKVDRYLNYLESCQNPDSAASQYTLEEWCGINVNNVKQELIMFYKPFYNTKYADWDTEHKHGWNMVMEEVAYWRKTNAVHNWFIENVQDGEDDCCYHNEVTREILIELRDICSEILDDHSMADELLPAQSGFFFGSTDYDDWYFKDLEYTVETINKILNNTDFDKEMIYYISSW